MTYLSAAPPLLVRDARIAFGDRLVARDLTLEFPAGRTTCLLGRSGVGKTSLLRWLAGLLPDAPRSQPAAYMAQSDLLLPWHACVLGLFDDILSGTPIGINGLVLTLVHWAVTSQHTFFRGKSFGVVWLAFSLLAPVAIVLIAALSFVVARAKIDPVVLLVQILLTVGLYPPVAWLLGRAQRFLLAGV